ncbi:hypothetical protein HPB47_027955, partial [Ixodes persulcatus]
MSFPQGVIFLTALLGSPTTSQSIQHQDTGSVLRSLVDILDDVLLAFDPGNKFLNVFVPPDCLEDNSAAFKDFLKSRKETVTLWTDGKKHWDACNGKPCDKFRQGENGRAFLSRTPGSQHALLAFHRACAARERSKLTRRRSFIEGTNLELEAEQAKDLHADLI